MRKETMQNKLAELLGLDQFKVEVNKKGKAKESSKKNTYLGVTEEEIQNFRSAQALHYFLQAPELFTAKTCPHCKEGFLVSRQFVAFCSYTCIKRDLEAKGISWSRGEDYELIVKEIYDGNEPLWIRNLPRIKSVLETLPAYQLLLAETSPEGNSLESATM